jgi:hypothetical protein
MADKAFLVTFWFTPTLVFNVNLTTSLNAAVVTAFEQVGLPANSVAADMSSSDSTGATNWGVNATVFVDNNTINSAYAMLQYISTTGSPYFLEVLTTQLNNTQGTISTTLAVTSAGITVTNIPTGAVATGVQVVVNGTTYTGTRLFDTDDSDEESGLMSQQRTLALPVFGVFGLLFLVAFIGMGIRHKRSSNHDPSYVAFEAAPVDEEVPLE